jgi:hypothetical protein
VMRIRDPLDELIFLHYNFCQNGLSSSSNNDILLMITYLLGKFSKTLKFNKTFCNNFYCLFLQKWGEITLLQVIG